jgi:hypothetical protein
MPAGRGLRLRFLGRPGGEGRDSRKAAALLQEGMETDRDDVALAARSYYALASPLPRGAG